MCIESSGYPGKEAAEAKGQEFIACRVDAGRSNSQFILPDGVEDNAGIGVGDLPHDGAKAEHKDYGDVVISNSGPGQPSDPRNAQFSTREVRKGKNESHQDDRKGKGGQRQIRTSEPEAWYPYDKACDNCAQPAKGDGAPWRDIRIPIKQSCNIGPYSKEEGMSEVHLAGKAGKEIPTCSKYGKDTGESEDAQKVGIFGKYGQEEEKDKKQDDNDTGWENKHFVFEYGKQLSQVK